MYGFLGCRFAGSEAKTTNLRYYKRVGRDRFDRKGIEKQHQMEVIAILCDGTGYKIVTYRGATPGPESTDVCDQLQQLKDQLESLNEQEKELDDQYEKMQVCLKNTMESIRDKQYPQ